MHARQRSGLLLGGYTLIMLVLLLLPVAVVVLFSFNDPPGRFNYTWHGFTLRAWSDPCGVAGLCEAVIASAQIAVATTVVSTVLGTLLAFGLVRHRFRGRGATNVLVLLPLATPEIVLGSSLLALLLNLGADRGFWTVVAAHVMFTVGYVAVTVKARLQGQDGRLAEAAADLYAGGWTTFRTVTLPLAFPGVAAAALLCFVLSFDDFVVTNFTAGDQITFPLFIWGAAARGIPPEVNVVATLVLAVGTAAVAAGPVLRRRAPRRRGGR